MPLLTGLANDMGEDMDVAPVSAFRFDANIRTSAWNDVQGHGIRQRQRNHSRPNGLAFHSSVTMVSVKKALMTSRKSDAKRERTRRPPAGYGFPVDALP
jgi:hypothetical protein